MKVFIVTPMDKGYQVDSCDVETKEDKVSAHNTRKNAVFSIIRKIPADKQFQIVWMNEKDETKEVTH